MTWDDDEIREANEKYNFSELNQGEEGEKLMKESVLVQNKDSAFVKENNLDHDTFFLFGLTKCGKTYAGCSLIEKCINDGGHAHIINNDNGVLRTMKVYFGKDFEKIKNKFTIYPIRDIEQIFPVVEKLEKILIPKDLLFIDLLNDFYELSQDKFLEKVSQALGVNIVDYIITASRDDSKFGLFDSMKWQYIKKLNNILMRKLIIYPKCNVVACNAVKDLKVREIFSKKDASKIQHYEKYKDLGYLPAGHDSVPSFFHTVIFIGETSDKKHFFNVMGHRGFIRKEYEVYDKNFYEAFMKLRK